MNFFSLRDAASVKLLRLDSIAISLFGNMTVEPREVHIITKDTVSNHIISDTVSEQKIQIIILILQWGRFRKSENFPDSNIFHAKTFWIERLSCKIVTFATRVRKTTLSTPIPMEERISITFWQNVFLQSKIHFTYYLDII